MKNERFEIVYDQGTAKEKEDGFIVNPPFFGVVDGVSAPYHYKMKRVRFEGMSSGEMVRQLILKAFYSAKSNSSLREIILQANDRIGRIQENRGINLERSDLLAGATFAFVKVEPKTVEIFQGGDCFALWAFNSGKIGITKNQTYQYELIEKKIIAELMQKHERDQKEIWVEYFPTYCRFRLENTNQKIKTGYAFLNGQSALEECWQRITIPSKDLKFLMLFTDGFVPFDKTGNEKALAKELITLYKKGGLNRILQLTRSIEEKKAATNHILHAEATAIAIRYK